MGVCPTLPHPGMWEIPLPTLIGDDGHPCPMMDGCNYGKGWKDVVKVLNKNFVRFYRAGRIPFPLYMHASWFERNSANFRGLDTFISAILENVPDAYFVTMSQLIEWVKNPKTVEQMKTEFNCNN